MWSLERQEDGAKLFRGQVKKSLSMPQNRRSSSDAIPAAAPHGGADSFTKRKQPAVRETGTAGIKKKRKVKAEHGLSQVLNTEGKAAI